jgi:NTP pyrophosphatase (non-canonical NTP hydrolase)
MTNVPVGTVVCAECMSSIWDEAPDHCLYPERHCQNKNLEDFQEEIYEINVANGWYEDERSFGDDIALLHSEVSEMYEAYRTWLMTDMTQRQCKTFDHSHPAPRGSDHLCKPEGVGSEAADIFIRLLDTCRRAGIDLRFETERKLAFNRTRGYKHGGKHV